MLELKELEELEKSRAVSVSSSLRSESDVALNEFVK
jgi:hypothetical protein